MDDLIWNTAIPIWCRHNFSLGSLKVLVDLTRVTGYVVPVFVWGVGHEYQGLGPIWNLRGGGVNLCQYQRLSLADSGVGVACVFVGGVYIRGILLIITSFSHLTCKRTKKRVAFLCEQTQLQGVAILYFMVFLFFFFFSWTNLCLKVSICLCKVVFYCVTDTVIYKYCGVYIVTIFRKQNKKIQLKTTCCLMMPMKEMIKILTMNYQVREKKS